MRNLAGFAPPLRGEPRGTRATPTQMHAGKPPFGVLIETTQIRAGPDLLPPAESAE